jgi:predicted acylesterase/phospholipase RssA
VSDRLGFLRTVSTVALAPALASAPADAALKSATPKSFSHALILSGGGARGAYEAGVVAGLVRRGGIADGQKLDPYGIVCGTSIGAINAWFVATGQYTTLARTWATLAAANIIQLKSKYVTLDHPHAFIAVRIRAALRLASGLTKNETGIARNDVVLDWMKQHIDPSMPVLVPLVWAVTNLTTQSPEYFYRLPPTLAGAVPPDIRRGFALTLGPSAVVREASDDILREALFASAAIPIVFDPVRLQMADGTTGMYVDGGIASNASIRFANNVARAIDVVFVDPRSRNEHYTNAIDILIGSYETMQRQILETEMRDVYFESLGKRATLRLGPAEAQRFERDSPALRTLVHDVPASDLAYLRPKDMLPVDFGSFDRQDEIDAAVAIGDADSAAGFTPYMERGFRL